MRSKEQILARIADEERRIQAAEDEIKLKRGSVNYDVEELQDLTSFIDICYQRVYLLEWVLGIREDMSEA